MDCTSAASPYAIPDLDPARRSAAVRAWHWIVDARAHRVCCLVGGLWLINIFDLILTLLAHHAGMLDEVNPVASFLLQQGPVAVCLYKVGLVAFGSGTLLYHRRKLLAELTAWTLLWVYALVAVQWKWCYELYELSHSPGMSNADLTRIGGWTVGLPTL